MKKRAYILRQNLQKTVSTLTICAIFSVLLLSIAEPIHAGEVTPTSITINWTAPGDNGTDGTATMYDIRFSTSPVNSDNWTSCNQAVNEPNPQLCGSEENFTITNLDPDTWYYIAMTSLDEALNRSELSNVIAVKTQSLSLDVETDNINIPENFQLAQNYPNPFNPSTKIEFSIPVTAYVTISIFNVLGQETNTIVDEIKPAGNYTITWNGTDSYGQKVSSGLYFYRINANDYTESKKMALVQ
ncbi:MAG: T9SS type A sorting domain-containing protein [candidate division Zixibacteria bacterium]|nr:T9SS type A sorting domain-containing protein [candidate division Zixibacteria bacterium]